MLSPLFYGLKLFLFYHLSVIFINSTNCNLYLWYRRRQRLLLQREALICSPRRRFRLRGLWLRPLRLHPSRKIHRKTPGEPHRTPPFVFIVIIFVFIVIGLLCGPLLCLPPFLGVKYPTHVPLNLPVHHQYQALPRSQRILSPYLPHPTTITIFPIPQDQDVSIFRTVPVWWWGRAVSRVLALRIETTSPPLLSALTGQ